MLVRKNLSPKMGCSREKEQQSCQTSCKESTKKRRFSIQSISCLLPATITCLKSQPLEKKKHSDRECQSIEMEMGSQSKTVVSTNISMYQSPEKTRCKQRMTTKTKAMSISHLETVQDKLLRMKAAQTRMKMSQSNRLLTNMMKTNIWKQRMGTISLETKFRSKMKVTLFPMI